MERQTNFVANSLVTSSFLNAMQDRMPGVRPLDVELAALWDWDRKVQGMLAQHAGTPIAATTAANIDNNVAPAMDWRKHVVEGVIADLTAGGPGEYLGGASENRINFELRKARRFIGFLGNGSSLSFNTATGDCFIEADYEPITPVVANFNLFADPVDGRLKLYNKTAGARLVLIVVQSLGSRV